MSLNLSDYSFDLPPELIAQTPAERRDASRMMILPRREGELRHASFADFPQQLGRGDLLVLNDTRVIPARLFGIREGGTARVEVLLLRNLGGRCWKAMVRPGRKLQPGSRVLLADGVGVNILESFEDGTRRVELEGGASDEAILDRYGVTPLPPYIQREGDEGESFHRERYQTVYAREGGSVAAPTAGLHFTPTLLEELEQKGVEIRRVTLHVGMGTFKPVQVEDITEHRMDPESYTVPSETADAVNRARAEGRRVVAVGTTTTRTLEYASRHGRGVEAGSGWADLFIYPGYRFRAVDGILTNFHLPGSTLVMLVSALGGRERVLAAYAEAVRLRYRFYSYGDCMLVL